MPGRARLMRLQRPAQTARSVFGMAVTVTGDLESGDPIRIDGTMEGDVRGTVVTVSRRAPVRGAIHATYVRLAGRVEGTVRAQTVILERHARLIGSIDCETLAVEPGAKIAAQCRAWRPEAAPAPEQAPNCEDAAADSPAEDEAAPAQDG